MLVGLKRYAKQRKVGGWPATQFCPPPKAIRVFALVLSQGLNDSRYLYSTLALGLAKAALAL